jgi:exosortase C (VPDSG-CTERM-specific)
LVGCGVCLIILAASYAVPLIDWARFSLKSSLYSHLVLMPFVSGYLVWLKRDELRAALDTLCCLRRTRGFAVCPTGVSCWAWLPIALGLGCVAWSISNRSVLAAWHRQDRSALMIVSLVLLATGAFMCFFGMRAARVAAFPLSLALLSAPFPRAVEDAIEVFFQHTSAVAADLMLTLSGMPMVRDGVDFQLPGFHITVGQECSGIHSTLVLFIVSLVGGHLYLRSPWRRVVFTLAVVPLAIVRNGFRIFTISQLCVRVSPDMINSYIHRKGGPIFFALFLIPLFALLIWMKAGDRRATRRAEGAPGCPDTSSV